ncbi:NADH dehydrogenase [ubiquinone] 1 alpha subcomplex subunit 13 [Microplitis mediator]|uniref:NADH dehydrogenase [ubiquinone] 1 alpha subcomplex subunit 13 n=1 Tax=Microplitis mediator TaxID=375433 RepID=UPI00255338FC|nr:NADH dehydrogenase [ubiquinone] 1 alpha subcomplex subunit 13 [Microplitis mediator]
MTSRIKHGPQDLPPKGGYNPIQTSRVALRRIVTPVVASGLTVATSIIGGVGFFFNYRYARREQVELRSARLALVPMLLAERDREFLKQIRKNRDEEANLMANYPGWEVGTYFGEPVFKNEPEEKLIEPTFCEYITHSNLSDNNERVFRTLFM